MALQTLSQLFFELILPSSSQAPAQLSWAELALILFPPAPARPPAHPAGHPAVRTSSEIAGNEQNLTK